VCVQLESPKQQVPAPPKQQVHQNHEEERSRRRREEETSLCKRKESHKEKKNTKNIQFTSNKIFSNNANQIFVFVKIRRYLYEK